MHFCGLSRSDGGGEEKGVSLSSGTSITGSKHGVLIEEEGSVSYASGISFSMALIPMSTRRRLAAGSHLEVTRCNRRE